VLFTGILPIKFPDTLAQYSLVILPVPEQAVGVGVGVGSVGIVEPEPNCFISISEVKGARVILPDFTSPLPFRKVTPFSEIVL
jgi:hypothetical protein